MVCLSRAVEWGGVSWQKKMTSLKSQFEDWLYLPARAWKAQEQSVRVKTAL